MLDSTNALQRRQIVATLVNAGLPTVRIAARLGVPISVVRTDRVFLSGQKAYEPKETNGKNQPLSREARREANRYQKLPEVVAARRASVIKLCNEGKTDTEIAADLGVSPATIVRDRVRLGIEPKDFDTARVERRKKVEEMVNDGIRKTDIARTLGVNKMTVLKDCDFLFGKPVSMTVRAANRRVIVREKMAENIPVIQIARLLNVAEMTIRRDLEVIAKEDAAI